MDNSLRTYSTAALTYLGDSILETCVRERLVKLGYSSSAKLNRAALDYVCATRQAEAVKRILPILTEEEDGVYHRGRNMSHSNFPKSATIAEYRAATGMEAIFGYLHLAGKADRIKELFEIAYPMENK